MNQEHKLKRVEREDWAGEFSELRTRKINRQISLPPPYPPSNFPIRAGIQDLANKMHNSMNHELIQNPIFGVILKKIAIL